MDYFVWDVSPILLDLSSIQLRWYGLLTFSSYVVSVMVIAKWILKREGCNLDMLGDLLLYALLGTLIGARLMHCLAYEPHYYLSHPFEILKFWEGGRASHGGLLGIAIALWFIAKKYNVSYLWLFSRMTILALFIAVSVRLGNFFNSEIIGKVTDVPWAVIFARVDMFPRHPVQLYEALSYFILFVLFVILYKKISPALATRLLPGLFLVSINTIRFLLEYTKNKQAVYTWDLPFNTGQMLSLPLIFIGIIWIIWANMITQKIK